MREHGVMFRGDGVRAMLDGRKDQTRRICKFRVAGPNPPNTLDFYSERGWAGALDATTRKGNALNLSPISTGDLIYVKETWGEDYIGAYLTSHGSQGQYLNGPKAVIVYRADGHKMSDKGTGWKSALFMPRWAARLWLKITEVRVQRVQEISEEDAKAEGTAYYLGAGGKQHEEMSMKAQFHALWDSINAKKGFGWDANPWVWAYTFKRVNKESKA